MAAVALLLTALVISVSSAGAAEISLAGARSGEHDPSHYKGLLLKKFLAMTVHIVGALIISWTDIYHYRALLLRQLIIRSFIRTVLLRN